MKKVFLIIIGMFITLTAQEQSSDCAYISKEQSISILTHSNVFKKFTKKYPANTKFAFPLEMIAIAKGNQCLVDISVYIDEDDHFSLIGNFSVKVGKHMMVSHIK